MSLIPGLKILLLITAFLHGSACAQEKKLRQYKRAWQISLLPGISTNGVASGMYQNKVSINLLGGLSGGNRIFEAGLISNANLRSSTGIQVAGFGNIVGANAFVNLTQSEERSMINRQDFEVSFQGIQIAGLLNYVLNHSKGIQLTAGLNVAGENFSGVQVGGIGNSAAGTAQGFQLAGLYNVVKESVAGIQISAAFNFTDAELSGTQLALFNKSRRMMGRHATPPTRRKGLQIGLVNFSREMHGTQIGLINIGGEVRGKQIGLINFFERIGSKENVRMGTPIGLLNFGSRGSYLRIYYSELFSTNLEFSTGNCLNCTWTQSTMPYAGRNKILNQNILIFGYDHWRDRWGFGYGFQKVLYNKVSTLPIPANEKRMIAYGIKVLRLNRGRTFEKPFNLLTRFNLDWGKRYRSIRWFVSVSANCFLYRDGDEAAFDVNSPAFPAGKIFGLQGMLWPGYSAGIQL